ncbi:MAG TPA: M15 family metallopeptidase [Propionibacteriaceae bacterium]|nr:M15 family metallopeptidase [Propionibacteriaceae bacterium]
MTGRSKGTKVGVYWYSYGAKKWVRSGVVAITSKGGYAFNQPVGYVGTFPFRVTLGGAPGKANVVSSNQVKVGVSDSYLRQRKLPASVDALRGPTVSGWVSPARARVKVLIQVRRANGRYGTVATATTSATGAYSARLIYGYGHLVTQTVRSAYRAANRPRWELSGASSVKRVRVLNAVITKTTSAEVAKTYRRGCPVGPSRLRTIRMNYYGFDRRMHRGVIIVRSTTTARVTRSFSAAMHAGYPIARMRNPNDYGGNDPRQMAADNTSGFNCRKVVGNPYAMSPHSYGTAIDVNTVRNPYRDRNGRWWPSNGRRYIDRTPLRRGMLGSGSTLTRRLQREGYFWGGRWSPGRDYQHFQR